MSEIWVPMSYMVSLLYSVQIRLTDPTEGPLCLRQQIHALCPPQGQSFWVITKEADGVFHGYLVPLWGSNWHFLIKLAHWSLIKVLSSWDETKGKIYPSYGTSCSIKTPPSFSPLIFKEKKKSLFPLFAKLFIFKWAKLFQKWFKINHRPSP